MTTFSPAIAALRELEAILLVTRPGESDPVEIGDQIEHVRLLLRSEDPIWIDAEAAARLLGVNRIESVATWVRMGLLSSRQLPIGARQILLDDVLARRSENEGLLAIGGDELTADELQQLAEGRPGQYPWQRTKITDVA